MEPATRWVRDRVAVLDGSWHAAHGAWLGLADAAVLTGRRCDREALLLDVRRAAFQPLTDEMDVLASALAGCRVVAILSGGEGSYWCAQMLATAVSLLGTEAAAFQDGARAWAWLGEKLEGAETDV